MAIKKQIILKTSKIKMYKNYNQCIVNQIIKVHTKFHQNRSVTSTLRRMKDKTVKKKMLQICYARYIKNFYGTKSVAKYPY